MSTEQTTPQPAPPAAEQLAERMFTATVATMETFAIYLGVSLGLYQALANGKTDARHLAERAGIHPRYAREWLEQQAVAGILEAEHSPTEAEPADPYARLFTLPAGHREVLLDQDSPTYLGSLPGCMVSLSTVLPDLTAAYRTGGGVTYEAYGELVRHGIAGMNRPMFRTQLADWLAALPDIQQRLAVGPANVLDLGCGTGSSSVAIAKLFASVRVHGVDLDAASVAEATNQAQRSDLAGRLTFTRADAASVTSEDRYELVCAFESLHDMADPVAALRNVRGLLAPGGAVLIGDERVGEQFSAPGDLVEQLNYGFSVLHCLPATRAEGSVVEAGTVLRPATVREYATEAGFRCTELPIAHDLWRFYRLDPT